MAILQPDGLFIEAGISDYCRGDLSLIGFDDADAVFGEILVSQVERIAVHNPLNHRRIQEAQPVSRTGNLVAHTRMIQRTRLSHTINIAPSVRRHAATVKLMTILYQARAVRQKYFSAGFNGSGEELPGH